MMEESKGQLKNRLARIFRWPAILRSSATSSSTTGASSRSLSGIFSDIAHEPVFIPRRRASEADELHVAALWRSLSLDGRRSRPLGSGSGSCGCRTSASHKKKDSEVKEKTKLFDDGEGGGRTCPPSSPSFHLYRHCFKEEETSTATKKKKTKKKQRIRSRYELSISSSSDEDGSGFFSSDEAETIFCTRSFSSDSSEFYRRPSPTTKSKNNTKKKKKKKKKQTKPKFCSQPLVSVPSSESEQPYGDGYAVLKRSTDPYRDFRNSMVEMIVERQIFGARELEWLLHCYLSLNSPEHHSAILRSFADVSQVLFSC